MRQGKFTAKERAYLISLPAVETVTQGRIFYTEEFKIDCMRRYHAGDSPVVIFSEAGLFSSLIGYKRIERCIARWREDERSGRLQGTQPGLQPDNFGILPAAARRGSLIFDIISDASFSRVNDGASSGVGGGVGGASTVRGVSDESRMSDGSGQHSAAGSWKRVNGGAGVSAGEHVQGNANMHANDQTHNVDGHDSANHNGVNYGGTDHGDLNHGGTNHDGLVDHKNDGSSDLRWAAGYQQPANGTADIGSLVLMRYESRLRSLEGRLSETIDRVSDLEREIEQRIAQALERQT